MKKNSTQKKTVQFYDNEDQLKKEESIDELGYVNNEEHYIIFDNDNPETS